MNFEDMPYQPPEWLIDAVGHVSSLGAGYSLEGDMEAKATDWAVENDRVVGEYFTKFLENPAAARQDMESYLGRFAAINREANILNRILPEQFGKIANIATMGYGEMDKDGRQETASVVWHFLTQKNSAKIPYYVGLLREPALMRDLALHWSALNWSASYQHECFMADNDWPAVQEQLKVPGENPLLFSLAAPLKSTPQEVRQSFETEYPELAGHGLDIIAAHMFNAGAHDEILSREMPKHYTRWEAAIDKRLQNYADEYRQPLLERIASTDWRDALLDPRFSFDKLYNKMLTTRFELNADGGLVRQTIRQ
jgi:hypothetical protein